MRSTLNCLRIFGTACLAAVTSFAVSAQAVAPSAQDGAPSLSIRGLALEANSPPGTCGCFWLAGGGADGSLPLTSRLSAVVDLAGEATAHVPGTSRGLSTITLLAGPRFTIPRHRFSLHLQALAGAARGFDADFRRGSNAADTQTAFGMSAGGAVDVRLHSAWSIRVLEAEFVQTNLSNGLNDRERNLRVGAGIVWRPSFHALQR